MKYRLGLDLGVGSIGSAIIELDEHNNPKNIIDLGVRIFEVSEGAEDRRLKRNARKNLIRTKKRLSLLAKKLFENNLWVNDKPEGTKNLMAKSPYKIRYDAVNTNLENPNYIGRVILHIAKHRGAGFISINEENKEEILDEEQKSKNNISSYDLLSKYLNDSNSKTIGEFFYKRIINNNKVIRQKNYAVAKHIVDYAIPRYLVKDEFNKIWDSQSIYFKQMQNPSLKKEIYDILFYEKAPAPYAIGKCIYFCEENRLPKAHPISEMRRIYESVNNIRIITDCNKRRLTIEERDKIINELLLKGLNAGINSIRKILNLNKQTSISLEDDKNIKAYLYSTLDFNTKDYIQNLSEEQINSLIEFLENPINPNDVEGRLYNEDQLIEKLKTILKINDEKQIVSFLTKLPKGRSMLGLSASKILIEKMKEKVLSPREITDELSKNDSRFMSEDEFIKQIQGTYQKLPYYGVILKNDIQLLSPLIIKNNKSLNKDEILFGKIANPAVHMILNQLRLVVNEIISIYGKPYDINIELGRDVGMSSKNKDNYDKQQKNNEKLNTEAISYLKDNLLPITTTNIIKYKLAKEQVFIDAYNPAKRIPHNFSGFEIEHIIPKAKGGTDSFNNLCLVSEKDNGAKSNMFAYEYFEVSKSPEEIREILKNSRKYAKEKAWRFEADAKERFYGNGDPNETNRYLNDTRYVSKIAIKYLRAIIDADNSQNRIVAVKGSQTAILRKYWNLLGLEYDLMNLDIPRNIPTNTYWIEENTGTKIESENKPDIDGNWKSYNTIKNKEWLKKPRIDHRHHAVDAIVVACVNRNFLKTIATETSIKNKHIIAPLPITTVKSIAEFRNLIIDKLNKINVSYKPEHDKNGQFHKDTKRTIVCKNPLKKDEIITVYTANILKAIHSEKDLEKLIIDAKFKDEWHPSISKNRENQLKLYNLFKSHINDIRQSLIDNNETNINEGKKEIQITENILIIKTFNYLKDNNLWKNDNFKCYESSRALVNIPKHKIAYESGNNYCIDFYQKDGKIGWECIKRFDINQKDFIPSWKQNGGKILYSVCKGDLLELDTPDKWKQYTNKTRCIAKVKKFSEDKISIDYMTDARMTSPKDKNLKYMFVDTISEKGLSYITKHNARKIELTPFGRIKKKHKVLWYGKKTKT